MNSKSLLLVLLIFNFSFCQKKDSFYIQGNTKAKEDSIFLNTGLVPKEFLDLTIKESGKGKLLDGKFNFKGTIKYPQMFNLFSKKQGLSDIFFIDKGNNTINVSFIEHDIGVQCNSKTQKEYEFIKNIYLDDVIHKIWESSTKEEQLKNVIIQDSLILDYIKRKPSTYVGFWLLVDDFNRYGSNKFIIESIKYFSAEIKNTHPFKVYEKKIKNLINLSFYKGIKLKNENLKFEIFNINNHPAKYTVLDFWYSYCGPCIRDFPKIKELNNKYRNKGLQIIGISVDKTKNILNWKKTIKDQELNWTQFLDENGVFSNMYSINLFPTLMLLNEKGDIIKRNISLEELTVFLNQNL